jgi:prophage regulatory protein
VSGGVLTVRDVQRETTLSRTTLWRLIRAGSFPTPVRLSPGRVGWRAEDVEAFIRSREAQTTEARP